MKKEVLDGDDSPPASADAEMPEHNAPQATPELRRSVRVARSVRRAARRTLKLAALLIGATGAACLAVAVALPYVRLHPLLGVLLLLGGGAGWVLGSRVKRQPVAALRGACILCSVATASFTATLCLSAVRRDPLLQCEGILGVGTHVPLLGILLSGLGAVRFIAVHGSVCPDPSDPDVMVPEVTAPEVVLHHLTPGRLRLRCVVTACSVAVRSVASAVRDWLFRMPRRL